MAKKDIQVLTPNEYNYLHRTSTNVSVTVTGIQKLIQEVTMGIIKYADRGLFHTDYGVGIDKKLPSTYHETTEQRAIADVTAGINKLKSDIITSQTSQGLGSEEMLRDLNLIDLAFDIAQSTWFVTVRVSNMVGEEEQSIVQI